MLQDRPLIALSLLSEIAQAISHLTPDRALLFLTESALSVTDSAGAILLTPHEKNKIMLPFVKSFADGHPEPEISEAFLLDCFNIYLNLKENYSASNIALNFDFELIPGASWWPVILASKIVALLVIFRSDKVSELPSECVSFLEIITPFMGSIYENYRLNNEMVHKNLRLSALCEISQQAESLIDFRDVYDSLGKVAKSFINFDAYLLYLPSINAVSFEARLTDGDTDSFPKSVELDEGPIGNAAKQRKPFLTYTKEFNSVLVLPIEVSGKLIGILVIASRKAYAYRDEDIIGLKIIATQIASIDHIFKDLINLKGFTERILESMASGVVVFDSENAVTFANHEIYKIMNRKFEIGSFPFKEQQQNYGVLDSLFKEVLYSNITVENKRIVLGSFPEKILEVNAFPFRSEEGEMLGTAFFIKDVTHINAMEEQLKRADRLSALGVLAAGVAHEIRNPLTGMKMIFQLLEAEFSQDEFRKEPLMLVQKEINRLELIIGKLLNFARPTKPKTIDVRVDKVLEDCIILIKNQLKKQGINLHKNFTPDCPVISGDPDQLQQVFINILTNAMQAQGNGGDLSVTVEYDETHLAATIQDTGSGISQKNLNDIFNPFMTTKEEGTGLGLSLAQRILEEHKGKIEVRSVLGEGSAFVVKLPLKVEQT